MGKGDKKTKKGKITIGSYGNSRPRKKVTTAAKPASVKAKAASKKDDAPAKKAPAKKAAAKKKEE